MSDHAPDPALAVFGSLVPIPANRTVFQEDEQIREVWHVAAGALKVWVWGSGGPSLVAVRTPGWLIGTAPAIVGSRATANVTTLTDCLLHRLPLADFHRLRVEHSPFIAWIQYQLAREATEQCQRTAALANGHTRHAFQALLTQLFRTSSVCGPDGSRRLNFALSMTDWASLVGISRQWLSQVLRGLAADGVVVRQDGWLVAPPGSPLQPDYNGVPTLPAD